MYIVSYRYVNKDRWYSITTNSDKSKDKHLYEQYLGATKDGNVCSPSGSAFYAEMLSKYLPPVLQSELSRCVLKYLTDPFCSHAETCLCHR